MTKKASILNDTKIYEGTSFGDKEIGGFQKGDYVDFTREYRRNEMNWYQVIMKDGQKGFIEKKDAFPWKLVKINTEEASFFCTNEENLNQRVPLTQGDQLYIIAPYPYKTPIYVVRDLKNREGRLSGQVPVDEVTDEWFRVVFWIIFIGIIILSLVFMVNAGFIVISGLLVLIIAGIALVGAIITFFLMEIIKAIVYQIRIRM